MVGRSYKRMWIPVREVVHMFTSPLAGDLYKLDDTTTVLDEEAFGKKDEGRLGHDQIVA